MSPYSFYFLGARAMKFEAVWTYEDNHGQDVKVGVLMTWYKEQGALIWRQQSYIHMRTLKQVRPFHMSYLFTEARKLKRILKRSLETNDRP